LGKDTFIAPAVHKKPYFFCSLFLLFFLSALCTTPAHAIRLTHVTHLFDVAHDFSQPSDVSVSQDGLIHIVDGVNNTIKVFDQSGKYLYSFGRKGDKEGEFLFPLGIDVDNSGRVYVADTGNQRVQIFTPRGSFLRQFMISSDSGYPPEPTDVVIDESRERCYVVDNNNHYILVYDLKTLGLITTYGSPGEEKLEFRYPFLIALDKYQHLYIVDVINTRIQLLNPEGLYVTKIGGWGVEKGEFFRPKGVAIDKNNRVYISDSYMGVIQVFESSGEFYSVIGNNGTGTVTKFKTPTGIFIDTSDRLYVVEMFADKVSVYKIKDAPE
jgi:DNA-binding beta-propeller fold protein YncE